MSVTVVAQARAKQLAQQNTEWRHIYSNGDKDEMKKFITEHEVVKIM